MEIVKKNTVSVVVGEAMVKEFGIDAVKERLRDAFFKLHKDYEEKHRIDDVERFEFRDLILVVNKGYDVIDTVKVC